MIRNLVDRLDGLAVAGGGLGGLVDRLGSALLPNMVAEAASTSRCFYISCGCQVSASECLMLFQCPEGQACGDHCGMCTDPP